MSSRGGSGNDRRGDLGLFDSAEIASSLTFLAMTLKWPGLPRHFIPRNDNKDCRVISFLAMTLVWGKKQPKGIEEFVLSKKMLAK